MALVLLLANICLVKDVSGKSPIDIRHLKATWRRNEIKFSYPVSYQVPLNIGFSF